MSTENPDISVHIIESGTMEVDGGAVFGIIPKVIWEKRMKPDSRNRVRLGIRQVLVKGPDFRLLIDTGAGTKLPPDARGGFRLSESRSWSDRLSPFGVGPDEITHVVLTHLHFDHVGGASEFDAERNSILPAFPNAELFVDRNEWAFGLQCDERSRGSYLLRDLLPLQAAGKVRFTTGDQEIIGGVSTVRTGGHTADHRMVVLRHRGLRIFFPGDICPTRHHLNPAWRSAIDLFPLESERAQRKMIEQALKEDHRIVFSHDPDGGWYRITGSPRFPRAEGADAP